MARGKDDKSEKDDKTSAESRSGQTSGPEPDAAKDAGSGRRPPHTIDLKAKEVDEKDVEEAADGDADKPETDAGRDASETEAAETKDDDATDSAKDKAETTAKPKPKPAPPRTTPGQLRGFVTHLAAGLVGGLIGVVGLGYGVGLPGAGQPPAETGPAPVAPETEARLKGFEDRLARIEESWSAQAGFPAAMKERALGIEEAAGDRETRLARVEEALAAQKDFPASIKESAGALEQRTGALDDRLGRLEERWKAQEGFPAAMKERVARLEETLKSLGEAASSGGDVAATAAFTSKLNDVSGRIDASVGDLKRDVEALARRVEALPEQKPDDAVAQGLAVRIGDLEKKIAVLAEQRAAQAAVDSAGSGKEGLDALAYAIARGRPFADELSEAKGRLSGEIDLAALQRHAAGGVPTRSVLLQRLRDHIHGTPTEVAPDQSDGSLMSRFLRSAQSVVRVRRTSDPVLSGSSPVVAKMLSLTRQGDLAGAVLAADGLTAEERGALKDWLQAAEARVDVDAALAEVRRKLNGAEAVTGSTQGQ